MLFQNLKFTAAISAAVAAFVPSKYVAADGNAISQEDVKYSMVIDSSKNSLRQKKVDVQDPRNLVIEDFHSSSKTLRNSAVGQEESTPREEDYGILNKKHKKHRELVGSGFTDCEVFYNPVGVIDKDVVLSCLELSGDDCPAPLGCWDTAEVTDMSNLFANVTDFYDYDNYIGDWDTGLVTNMYGMFYNTDNFGPISLERWNVSKVTNMKAMFTQSTFNKPLDDWDVSNCYSFSEMFMESSFNQPLDNWDVAKLTSAKQMFYSAADFNQCISSWHIKTEVPNQIRLYDMFYESDCEIHADEPPEGSYFPDDPITGPWCQEESEECPALSRPTDSPTLFPTTSPPTKTPTPAPTSKSTSASTSRSTSKSTSKSTPVTTTSSSVSTTKK